MFCLFFSVLRCLGTIPSVDNATVSGSEDTYNAARIYTCFTGYEYEGGHQVETSYCTSPDGLWSDVPDNCSSKLDEDGDQT